ncbi:uncharacterized protein LOC123701769 isoform X2 [Colias croceus]|nr:uncharacterized protein LOC123701769 isoform X2 [Colias croceus]XP_045505284.1 uncharacterized protein LOC123701769 isoform X2 [Colias croceus]
MSLRTSKASYRQHGYSGSRKSLKRVRSAMKRYHGEGSRVKVWRSEETKKQPVNEEIAIDYSIITQNTQLRTYSRVRPSTVKAEPVVDPLEINWPQPDPEIDSLQLIVEPGPNTGTNKCLSAISGYRIVDLKHVIEWAFLIERHRNMCESSQIEFVSERLDGFRSELIFKCSMCDEAWTHFTESSDKINTEFVRATVTSGSCYTQAAQITSLMDIPTMSANKFHCIEKNLGSAGFEHLTEEIKK